MRTVLFILASMVSTIGSACCGSADITYTSVSGNTFRIEVIVYACLSSPSDRPMIEVSIDQAASILIPRTNIVDDPAQDIRRNEYTFEHEFVEFGMHTVDALVGMRSGGVVNIPSSSGETFCLQAQVLVDPMITSNSSIRFATPPSVLTQNWNTFVHQPDPTDADGDSLSFEWVVPRGTGCFPIADYDFPTAVNACFVESGTGTFTWDYPPFNGEYTLAIRGSEYRNGQLIGQVTRDMTLCIAGFIAGVDDLGAIHELSISPSLTSGLIQIENPSATPLPISFHDARGALVLSQTLKAGRSSIDIAGLPSGAYFVSGTSAAGLRFGGRVLKQ